MEQVFDQVSRLLKHHTATRLRNLGIRTYKVLPLSTRSGLMEFVPNTVPLNTWLMPAHQRYYPSDYNPDKCRKEIGVVQNDSLNTRVRVWQKVADNFHPVLRYFFTEHFLDPDDWFEKRLAYTRSTAAISILGHVLGLGDRHGENVLLEEGNGGTFHVDFNCLFDKGLTFEKPELVPFRLTHNMVDAMGPQGIEGPFRKAAELTYTQLRQHEDTLITVLETFVHDPTADFLGGKRKKRSTPGVPETPQEVLESVRMKVHGVLKGETVPLSVEGYVEELVRMARDSMNLASMYIGWCAFL